MADLNLSQDLSTVLPRPDFIRQLMTDNRRDRVLLRQLLKLSEKVHADTCGAQRLDGDAADDEAGE